MRFRHTRFIFYAVSVGLRVKIGIKVGNTLNLVIKFSVSTLILLNSGHQSLLAALLKKY